MNLIVDSGASGHFVDSNTVDDFEDRLKGHVKLRHPREIHTAGKHVLYGVAKGSLNGKLVVADEDKMNVL